MIIDSKTGLTGLSSQNSQKAVQKAESDKTSANKSGSAPLIDSVQISDEAQKLKRLEDSISAAPTVDEDKVSALRAAIADGSYKINADKIAEKILASEGF